MLLTCMSVATASLTTGQWLCTAATSQATGSRRMGRLCRACLSSPPYSRRSQSHIMRPLRWTTPRSMDRTPRQGESCSIRRDSPLRRSFRCESRARHWRRGQPSMQPSRRRGVAFACSTPVEPRSHRCKCAPNLWLPSTWPLADRGNSPSGSNSKSQTSTGQARPKWALEDTTIQH